MTGRIKRYGKYVVIKWADVDKYLDSDSKHLFEWLIRKIEKGRLWDYKPLHNYVVVNQAEPYADQVWNLIVQNQFKDAENEANETGTV